MIRSIQPQIDAEFPRLMNEISGYAAEHQGGLREGIRQCALKARPLMESGKKSGIVSSLYKHLQVGGSTSRLTMAHTTVHPRAQFALGVDCDFFSHQSFQQLKKQAGPAAVSPPSLLRFQISSRLEIGNSPLDGGLGECKIFGNGREGGPAFSLPIRPAVQIDVNGFCPVGQLLVLINRFQPTHAIAPP